MTLPDVALDLPSSITTPEATRIARFLQHQDDKFAQSLTLTLYGSAAVSLYLADADDYAYGYTDDIDVGHKIPNAELKCHTTSVSPPLHFQEYGLELRLVHPDWQSSCLDFSGPLNLKHLKVRLLHPIDLVSTKLARGADQDIEDSIRLRQRYFPDQVEQAESRIREAWKYHRPSERERRKIEESFEVIFEHSLDLND